MDTNELIKALAADARQPFPSLPVVWWTAAGIAVLVAAIVFQLALGVRPDFAAAAETPRFLFKFVVTVALAGGAFGAARTLSRPDGNWRKAAPYLIPAPVLLVLAVIAELLLLPQDVWAAKTVGMNNLVCLFYIPLIGIGPLAVFVAALRHGAPARPAMAGAIAGLLAGGISATFYAAHCTDDSPLFVIVWYTLAVAMLAFAGAVAARRLARW